MSSARNVAEGFSITGLLDESSKTRERYPVVEIDVSTIADHPANVAYSMDREAIRKLAASIAESGLTDIPLVRKMAEALGMMSGQQAQGRIRVACGKRFRCPAASSRGLTTRKPSRCCTRPTTSCAPSPSARGPRQRARWGLRPSACAEYGRVVQGQAHRRHQGRDYRKTDRPKSLRQDHPARGAHGRRSRARSLPNGHARRTPATSPAMRSTPWRRSAG